MRTDYWEKREKAEELKAMLREQSSRGGQAVKDKWAQVPVPEFRTCRICKIAKLLNKDNFSPARNGFGFDYRCKPCNADRTRLKRKQHALVAKGQPIFAEALAARQTAMALLQAA